MPTPYLAGRFQAFDNSGNPLALGKLYSYEAGTLTPLATYTDDTLTTPNTNPVVLDSAGRAEVWLANGTAYRFVLKDAAGVTITDDEWTPADGAELVDLSASSGSSLVGWIQSGTGAEARTVQAKLRESLSVLDFGAVGDGVTDDAPAFVAALAAARRVLVPPGTYSLASTITLSSSGHCLAGTDAKYTTVLLIDHTSGPGVTLANTQCRLENLSVSASDARQAYTVGDTYALADGLFGVKIYNATGFLTQCQLDRVLVDRHPNHGIYMGGEGAGAIFRQCESTGNRGHGYAFDDRTIGGGTSSRCGIVTIESCRAVDNGGNGLHLSQTGSTCYRFAINELETLWNAWNTSIASLVNAEIYIGGQNHTLRQCGAYDANGDARTANNAGDTRLAKSALSSGIYIRGSAEHIIIENQRFLSMRKGVETSTAVGYLNVIGGYFTQQQVGGGTAAVEIGFDIGAGATHLRIDVPPSSVVTTMVDSNTLNAYPLVMDKTLEVRHDFTTTAAFETVLTEDVYLPVGFYRFSFSATVENGATPTRYSMRLSLDGTPIAKTSYVSIPADEYATLNQSYVYEVTTAATTTVDLEMRQQAGPNQGAVLAAGVTFGGTGLQIERIL